MTDHMRPIPSGNPASSAGGQTARKSTPGEDVFLIDLALQEYYAISSIDYALDHWGTDPNRLENFMHQAKISLRLGREAAGRVRQLPPHRLRAALAQRPGVVVRPDGVVAHVESAGPDGTNETSGRVS